LNKILVTPRSLTKDGHPSLDRFKEAGYEVIFSTPGQQPSEQELLSILPNCIGMLAGVESITAKALQSAKNLKAISRNGVGTNAIDKKAAEKLGIKILTTPGANARSVAELAFGHILSVVRSIPFCDSAVKKEVWKRKKGIELKGRTLGIVGCGNIGKLVAKFALGFDMKVMAYDPVKDDSFKPSDDFNYCSFDELTRSSDIISLHCPPNEDGSAFIDSRIINNMKDGVYLVNTARAELLDVQAVLKAVDTGKIAGLTLDVFWPEPPNDWQLAKHPDVVATTHIGSYTKESIDRATGMAVDNLINELKK